MAKSTADNRFQGDPMAASAGAIKNIFVLLLENRSFGHTLGFSRIQGIEAETNPLGRQLP
jgi:phospholipase C